MPVFSKYWLLSLFFAFLSFAGFCQAPDEKLIVKDAGDSLLLKAFRTSFDTAGNYYFETMINDKGNKFTLTTNQKKYNAVYWDRNIAIMPYKALIANAFYADSSRKKIYYKNKSGTRIYGPYAGRIREVLEYGK